jgi:hypothetical protein
VSTLYIGLSPGARACGVVVTLDDQVLEAATIGAADKSVSAPRVDARTDRTHGSFVAVVDAPPPARLGAEAWTTALDIVRTHAPAVQAAGVVGAPVIVIAAVTPRRASVGRGRVCESVIGASIAVGALAAILHDQHYQQVAVDGTGDTVIPDVLTGTRPSGWRGSRGVDRQPQRDAWLAIESARGATTSETEAQS